MKGREVLKAVMERKDVSNAKLAKRLGITNATMWARLNTKSTKDIPISALSEMLRTMDYKIVVMPNSTRTPDGALTVD